MKKHINSAIVEEKRPPIYTAMKYWGKKPHNIWGEYIKTYTPQNGIIFDPFAGSALSAFEAVRNKRKVIAFDLNPLTSFIIEVFSTNFDKVLFKNKVDEIFNSVHTDMTYKKLFGYSCPSCNSNDAVYQHFKWDNGSIYEAGIECPRCGKRQIVTENLLEPEIVKIPTWIPDDIFPQSPTFTSSFIRKIGGNKYSYIWTNRNLYVISTLFNYITTVKNKSLMLQLLFGFIQSVHLCSKMCIPRRKDANREFSTSWGRAAYICSNRQMEMNPLLVFKKNCLGKQSVRSALENAVQYLGKKPSIQKIHHGYKVDSDSSTDICYGIVDISNVSSFIEPNSIDFIITDPPYGGLVQYLDLSMIWLVWLKRIDNCYAPSFDREITIKSNLRSANDYNKMFTVGMKELYKVLKKDGIAVFTFHNKDLTVWNAFLRSLGAAGFQIEKIIHQQNRRTGESNVANPYGTSASDFYIRCRKSEIIDNIISNTDALENFVVQKATSIISARGEPTPYQMLFNGLLAEVSLAHFTIDNFDYNINTILKKHIGTHFVLVGDAGMSGDLWWISNPALIPQNIVPLQTRVDTTIHDFLKQNGSATFDEIIGILFSKYPNGLTPDIRKIEDVIKKYAKKEAKRWIYNGE